MCARHGTSQPVKVRSRIVTTKRNEQQVERLKTRSEGIMAN